MLAATCDDVSLPANTQVAATPLNNGHFTLLGLKIDSDTLDQVKARLGETSTLKRKEGDAARLCYKGTAANAPVVFFEAGAMGGWKTLTGICVISAQEARSYLKNCKSSEKISADIATQSGIKLGMALTALPGDVGAPTTQGKKKNTYWHVYQDDKKFDVTEVMSVSHKDGKVAGFHITRAVSN